MNQAQGNPKGNIWYNWPGAGCDPSHQISAATFSADRRYDVAVLGAGVIGCALAYQLSQYRLRVVVIDRAFDVGEGTSKGNSAIIATGFDATPGSLESQLVTSASKQWPELAQKLKIPFKAVSALLLALNDEQFGQLPAIREESLANGVEDVELVSADEVLRMEPHVARTVRGALLIARESIVDPFTTSIAYAEVAQQNGVDFAFGVEISGIESPDAATKWVVGSNGVRIPARLIVNACGLGSRRLVDAYRGEPMDINPRRGQFVVYDRDSSHLVNRILLPIPTKHTKGMLVFPTIFGNLIAGPTAEDLPPDHSFATNTTAEGQAAVLARAKEMCPSLADQPVIATYAGLRCNCSQGSYWMRFNDGHPGIVTLSGIRSTGLTASISTAQYVIQRMSQECGLELHMNNAAVDSRPESKWPGWWRRPFDDSARIAANPDYGRIVCSCENISRGEICDALASCQGVATLDGLKRRTRVLTGRCQGFNCCVPTGELISQHFNIPLSSVTKRGPGTEFIARSDVKPNRVVGPTPSQRRPASHYRVVVVGAGPAGIGTAVGLAKRGVAPVLLIDRAAEIGGVPAKYEVKSGGVPTFIAWKRARILFGRQFVDGLRQELDNTNTEVCLECQVLAVSKATKSVTLISPRFGKTELQADAVVFACGARERSSSERGGIFGARPAGQFFTMQLLQLLDGCHVLPIERPAIIGSDLVAFSAAAKLRAAGAEEALMIDRRSRPAASVWERLYFSKWCRPDWHATGLDITISDNRRASAIHTGEWNRECDGVVLCGELIPNSELIVAAGFDVSQPGRVPIRRGRHELTEPGWFVAGAEVGGFHGAAWCYRDGRKTASDVAKYLRRLAR